MKNLVLNQLIQRFRPPPLEAPPSDFSHRSVEKLRRELAVLASEMMGAQTYLGQFGMAGPVSLNRQERRQMRNMVEETPLPFMVIDPRPGLRIMEINQAYADATLTRRDGVSGERLFDTFPDNPDVPDADGVSNLFESIKRATQTGQAHTMAIQRYDVRDAEGAFVQRYWRPVNIPIFDDEGRLLYVLHDAGELDANRLPASITRAY